MEITIKKGELKESNKQKYILCSLKENGLTFNNVFDYETEYVIFKNIKYKIKGLETHPINGKFKIILYSK